LLLLLWLPAVKKKKRLLLLLLLRRLLKHLHLLQRQWLHLLPLSQPSSNSLLDEKKATEKWLFFRLYFSIGCRQR
jgi:hypothetical protein